MPIGISHNHHYYDTPYEGTIVIQQIIVNQQIYYVLTCSLSPHTVPDIAIEIIITSQQKTTRLGEGYRSDPTDNVVMGVHAQLLVSTNVKQTTSGII